MWSWHIGTIRDIQLKVHVTFPLILIWAGIQFSVGRESPIFFAIYGILLVLLLFVCVLLHELGHALMALRFGISVSEIILLPIGGLAKLKILNDNPKQEFAIAAAGPLVNVLIALLLLPLLTWFISLQYPTIMNDLLAPEMPTRTLIFLLSDSMQRISVVGAITYLCFANLMLTVFNLIPAFPMDGGRLLRSLLAMVWNYSLATTIAVRLGQLIAILFAFFGLSDNLGLLLVALFVFISGQAELQRIALRKVLERGQVRHYTKRAVRPLYPEWSLHSVLLLTQQSGHLAFPVVENGRLLGLLTVREIQAHSSASTVEEAMIKKFTVLKPDSTLYEAQLILQAKEHFAGVVIDGEVLLGVLSLTDIEQAYQILRLGPPVQVV